MQIRVSGVLRKYVDYHRHLTYDAPTARSALEQLCADHPPLTTVLFESGGGISALHRIFVDGDQLAPDALDDPLTPDATVEIVTAIAGG
ncbi:MoaD/ThiS family protein [Streptomyces monticola]|uniref:MoaD/ThiS family protein n=1 Tax=Streptomyces monticola TaxID=2666263 RepID=A0ABW2JSX0_9ACTN